MTKELLKHGLDPDEKGRCGRNPLSYASGIEVTKILLKTRRFNPDSKANEGRTPLFQPIPNGEIKLAEYLVENWNVDTKMSSYYPDILSHSGWGIYSGY